MCGPCGCTSIHSCCLPARYTTFCSQRRSNVKARAPPLHPHHLLLLIVHVFLFHCPRLQTDKERQRWYPHAARRAVLSRTYGWCCKGRLSVAAPNLHLVVPGSSRAHSSSTPRRCRSMIRCASRYPLAGSARLSQGRPSASIHPLFFRFPYVERRAACVMMRGGVGEPVHVPLCTSGAATGKPATARAGGGVAQGRWRFGEKSLDRARGEHAAGAPRMLAS
ncbi:hypothetical protein C8R45DRAFT_497043 [Mycena sanguinolenta]|nr:hypothetical protein C8R45DRAFT_497043 [Mycena sanguinolenta]